MSVNNAKSHDPADHSDDPILQHTTQQCTRALVFDGTNVDTATQVGACLFWTAVTVAGARNLVKDDLLALLGIQDIQSLKNVLVSAFQFVVWGRKTLQDNTIPVFSRRCVIACLKVTAWTAISLLSYCPIGRLAFGRALRRRTIKAVTQDGGVSGNAFMRFVFSMYSMASSPQGILCLSSAVLLPRAQQALYSNQQASNGILRRTASTIFTLFRVAMTVTSGVAAYTQANPNHLIPSNPWLPEPVNMDYLRLSSISPQAAVSSPIGVLICNLGTTPSPKPNDVASFLQEFLMDPRVVEIYPLVWNLVLNGFIIPIRKYTSGQLYERLFNNAGTGSTSPLEFHTRSFATTVQSELGGDYIVEYGMRYGNPSIAAGLSKLKAAGCERILVFPKYPQYSGTTTASIYDDVFTQLMRYRFVPTIRVMPPYFNSKAYVDAVATVASQALQNRDDIEKFVISFHGIPERYHLRGDPYPWHCEATAHAIAHCMGWKKEDWLLSYQSVFGKDPWLLPATDETVERLATEGIKRVAVLCPGFLTDCLETIDENGTENAKIFEENGGEELVLVPCVNSSQVWCRAAAQLIQQETQNWLTEMP